MNFAYRLVPACLAVLLLVLVGCETSDVTESGPAEAPAGVYAYTLLGEDGGAPVAYARVVYDEADAACPTLTGGRASIATAPRYNAFPEHFAATVCEAGIPLGQALDVGDTGLQLAAIRTDPERILLYGDTGCKEKECPSGAAHPFAALADSGAARQPHLILHMGDYNYRGTGGQFTDSTTGQAHWPYDAGDGTPDDTQCELGSPYYSMNSAASSHPDQWSFWQEDFFEPAAELLPMAPWVFARGNHELCSRAGPGWFYFLAPGLAPDAGATASQCPPQDADGADPAGHLAFVAPYTVELDHLRVLVLDSANACDGYAPDSTTAIYTNQFNTLFNGLAGDKPTWFMTHRPVWGVDGPPDSTSSIVNQTLQKALAAASGGSFPEAVALSLSGHMHRFESLTFFQEDGQPHRPPQIIIGDSGVELSSGPPHGSFCAPDVDGLRAEGASADQHHAFLDVTYQQSGSWTGELVDTHKSLVLATCSQVLPAPQAVAETPVCLLDGVTTPACETMP